jgi:hypothetical protein
MKHQKLHALKFALAAGIYGAIIGVLITVCAILEVPGLTEFAKHIETFYQPWGYSISWLGTIVGGLYGFQEGFVHVGLFVLIYNKLLGSDASGA